MNKQDVLYLISVSDVVKFHRMIIKSFGGRDGIHNIGLLESALDHPLKIIDYGKKLDKTLHNLAAIYFYYIIKNHAFIDGNKRTALFTVFYFLGRNGFSFEGNQNDLYDLALETAASPRESENSQIKKTSSFFKDWIRLKQFLK